MPPAVRLLGLTEIGEGLGLSKQRVHGLAREIGQDFPAPLAELRQGRVWDADTVEKWAAEHGRAWNEPDGADRAAP